MIITVIHAQRELDPSGKNRDSKFRKYYVRIFPTPGGTIGKLIIRYAEDCLVIRVQQTIGGFEFIIILCIILAFIR